MSKKESYNSTGEWEESGVFFYGLFFCSYLLKSFDYDKLELRFDQLIIFLNTDAARN